ncbi:ATP-binding protein [Prevotella sp.]|uniref:ATP-binding protein n=1 Tax=Prevotella sp. TaxID=59823 RepID=UPI002A833008|nr:ATP-binding protein [Prevotella sp.]MDY4645807.1 ATP-binding protein [Prevotella sp.]
MISKDILKQVLATNQNDIKNYKIVPRELPSDDFTCRVYVGVRRAGKSFMLYQKIQQLLALGHSWDEMLYLNFEDDRLTQFDSSDFELILEAHAEMYGKRPMLFLDEIQNIEGWEKFARRLADAKYYVWVTGSNAKMLSSEVMTTLGGRYLATEVYPYDFREFLKIQDIAYDEISLLATESRAMVLRAWNEYLLWGGLPESVGLAVKRDYLSSTFQKIYLGDIASRHKIANPNILRLMLKKLAENVGQPVSYNRLANVLSSVSGKITMPTVSKYIEYSEAAWLLLRLRNVSAPFAEKETSCKYYFIDNGVLDLFLLDGETMLLENIVALALFRKYGHDSDNERVFFYNNKVEVDFYVPYERLAIQVSYSITQSPATYEREVNALKRIPGVLSCKRRLILTNDESDRIEDSFGTIEVMPVWKWLLQ